MHMDLEKYVSMKYPAIILAIIFVLVGGQAAAAPNPLQQEIVQLTADIDNRQLEIDAAGVRLEELTKDIIKTYQQLDAQEAAHRTQKQVLDARIGQVYKTYDMMLINIFFDLRDFSNIWKKLNFLAKVNEFDQRLLQANSARLQSIRRLKEELAQKKSEQITIKNTKLNEYAEMQNSLLQKKALIEQQLREEAIRRASAYKGRPTTTTP